jgi:hypothetical protein
VKTILLAAFGWLVPGGTYLLTRRYLSFALFAGAVWSAFAAGMLLHGGAQWPAAADLAGLDGGTALFFRAGALAKAMAGAPYLLAQALDLSGTFLGARLHEQGTTLLTMAGVINALAISSSLETRKERANG